MDGTIVEPTVNGRTVEEIVEPMEPLQSVLRNKLGQTATKTSCKQVGCGICTVLVDGEPVVSCLLPTEAAVGKEITTLEGVNPEDELNPFRKRSARISLCSVGTVPRDDHDRYGAFRTEPGPGSSRNRRRDFGKRLSVNEVRSDRRCHRTASESITGREDDGV